MRNRVTFAVPQGITRREVAETFNAYLMGSLVFGPHRNGPIEHTQSVDGDRWQLDHTNDYFLHFEGETAHLDCRYNGYFERIEAAVALFKLSYKDRRVTVEA